MPNALTLEEVLKGLCKYDRALHAIDGMAGVFESEIGQDACQKLADIIKDLIDGDKNDQGL